jgi:hypothetical protein
VLTSARNLTTHTLPAEPHGAYQSFSEEALMTSDEVPVHSKWYFDKDKGFL